MWATWLNGEHRWTGTGQKGNELDLAGLVCNNIKKKIQITVNV